MRDPVTLPVSRVTLDRATILQHVLSDPTDPFNKQPLSMEQVVPNTELKAQIDAWVATKRQAPTA
jgi:ubiquitin conjugation factor E4 B